MPNVSFFLKDTVSGKDSSIQLQYWCSDGRLKYYTGETGNPKDWDFKAMMPSNKGTRAYLRRLATAVEELAIDYKFKGEPFTRAVIKSRLDQLRQRGSVTESENLFDRMRVEVEKMESGIKLTPRKKRYSAGSIKTYNFTIGFLEKFDSKMTMASITMDTYHRFIQWCHDQDYSTNYIGSQIKNWKALCKSIGGNEIFDKGQFKKIEEDATDIYLSEEEIELLVKVNLSKYLETVRDWFVIDCYTGLRISDLLLLSDKNLNKDFMTIANKKTGEKVVIPLHPHVKAILAKYKGLPPKVGDQDMNEHIKVVAEKAGIDEDVLFTITKGGKRQDTYMKKWEAITNHTARRSFITNLRKNGVPDTIVMKLTGIKSPLTLKKYDKLSPDEAAKIAAGLNFFN